MNEALMVSNVLLWIAVLVLLVAVIALSRQIGILYERVAPMGALVMDTGPKAGDLAPAVAVLELGQGLYRRGGVGFEHIAVDATGLEGLFGFHQLVFGVAQLLFKEKAALLSLSDCQSAEQVTKFFYIRVGQLGGKGWVFVAGVNANQAVFTAGDLRILF